MQFERGFLSYHFVNNPGGMSVVLNKPYVITYDGKITEANSIVPVLQKIAEKDGEYRSLLIIASSVEGGALATLVQNSRNGVVPAVAVAAPEFGVQRQGMLNDLAILTGGKFISEAEGDLVQDLTLEDLGKCDRVVVTAERTTIIGGHSLDGAIKGRIEELKGMIAKAETPFVKDKLNERIARIQQGVAVVKVGAATDVEKIEKLHRVEDAIGR